MLGIIINQFVSGLTYSALLFVVASGLVLVFGALRIINLAHGSLYMLAAYMTYSLARRLPDRISTFLLIMVIIFFVLAFIGGVIEFVLVRRVYRSEHIFQLVLTFGLVWILADVTRVGWGVGLIALPRPQSFAGPINLLGYSFPLYNLIILGAAVLIALLLWVLLHKTYIGMVIRAITNNPDMASSLGVNVPIWRTWIFALGSGMAGIGGVLAAPLASLSLGMDWKILMDLFIVIVIGGLGSLGGAMIGAFILGQVNAFGILILPRLALIFGFVAMAIVLLIRPMGLMGKED